MTFFKAYGDMWANGLDFKSRTGRAAYWKAVAVSVVIGILLVLVSKKALPLASLLELYGLAAIVPGIALVVRRLHDIGRSGWWYLLNFIPFIGSIIILVLMLLPTYPGNNRWGAPAKLPKNPYA